MKGFAVAPPARLRVTFCGRGHVAVRQECDASARSNVPMRHLLLLFCIPRAPRAQLHARRAAAALRLRVDSGQVAAHRRLDARGGSRAAAAAAAAPARLRSAGPDGAQLFTKRELHGHFAVTAQHAGLHRVCLTNNAARWCGDGKPQDGA